MQGAGGMLKGVWLAIFLAACQQRGQIPPAGEIGFHLDDIDEEVFKVEIVNRSTDDINFLGLFDPSYAQASVMYEVEGAQKPITHNAIPLFVDLAKRHIVLAPDSAYAVLVNKEDFRALYSLSGNKCYTVRAKYNAENAVPGSQGQKWRSLPTKICF